MDATLVWTVIGSGAGVAGVAVAVVTAITQARSGRTGSSKVTAELGFGQLALDGVLYVQFTSGKTDVMTLPKPGGPRTVAEGDSGEKVQHTLEPSPVNAIFVRNDGDTGITVSRCHYVSDLGGIGFRFEPQSAVSARGDLLPKRLGPGEDAVLVHDLVTMRVFLNRVLLDHRVETATFQVVLTLGNGTEVAVPPSMQVRVDMNEQELAASGLRLVRQEIPAQTTLVGQAT